MSKILVIDGKKDNLASLNAVLKILNPDYEVITAQSGQEGIKKTRKELPDTILLDLSLPEMDGFEVCKLLKSNDEIKHIPIIMMTAGYIDSRRRINAFKLGADAFLTKPIDEAELGAQVNVMLRIKEAEDKLRMEKESLEDLVQVRTIGLRESQINLQTLFNSIDDFLFVLDMKGNILNVNLIVLRRLGYLEEELLGKSVLEVHPPDLRDKATSIIADLVAGKTDSCSIPLMAKDGTKIPVETKVTRGHWDDKDVFFGISRDITERKKAEENNLRLAEVIRNACDGIVLTNTEGQIHYVNPAFEKMNGYTESELLNKDPADLIVTDDTTPIANEIRSAVKSKGEWKGELSCRRKNGDIYPIDTRVFAIKDTSGKLVEIAAIQQDITERKQAEEELQRYFENRDVLIREINHRVRNNLTAIISMIYTEETLAEKKGESEFLPVLRNLAVRILGLSTVHSMLSESEWQPLKIAEICENVINATFKSINSLKEIKITIAPSEVRVESYQSHHLALVINELTTNSMKHAFKNKEKGNISINIGEEGENILLHFRDDGPGYPKEMLKGDFSKTGTGFEIIRGIVKQNLAGQLKLRNDNGAVTTIIFKKVIE